MKKRSLLLSTSLVLCSFAIGQESPQVAPAATTGESTTTVPTETTVLINEEPASASSTPLLQDTMVVETTVVKLDTLVNNQNPLDTTILVSTTTSKDMTITPKEDTHVRDGNSEKDQARVYPKVNHWSIAGHGGVRPVHHATFTNSGGRAPPGNGQGMPAFILMGGNSR